MAAYSIVAAPGTPRQQVVPVDGLLLVGRECAGVQPAHRLILDDPAVSRVHLELRVHPTRGAALIDQSTNGTRVNGRRVDRGEHIALRDGDRIQIGAHEILFAAPELQDAGEDLDSTIRTFNAKVLLAVVGDIVGYTTLSEAHGAATIGRTADQLFASLAALLAAHHGTVSNYAGDAMFAAWDALGEAEAPARAVRFAVEADELVVERARALSLETDDGPLRMGWAVTMGEAATSHPSRTREVVHGDAVNLAFRLAGLAARDGRPAVLVTEAAAAAAPGAASYGPVEELTVRGRSAPARVRAATRVA